MERVPTGRTASLEAMPAIRDDKEDVEKKEGEEEKRRNAPASALFKPLRLGDITLAHRVIMAPLTRMRAAEPNKSPWAIQADYYGQRASKGGLLIAEATQIDQTGQGYPSTPGIYTKEHREGTMRQHIT